MTHKDLVDISYRWLLKSASCGVAFKELVSANREIPDAIGFGSRFSILIECKVSRSDFLRDMKKEHRSKGMGMYKLYCCPEGMISKEELPHNWGLIYVNNQGKARCIVNPMKTAYIPGGWGRRVMSFDADLVAEQSIMYSALRRLHLRGRIPEIYDGLSKKVLEKISDN